MLPFLFLFLLLRSIWFTFPIIDELITSGDLKEKEGEEEGEKKEGEEGEISVLFSDKVHFVYAKFLMDCVK